MNRVRIGFVGVGAMGQIAHLANYARLRDDVQVVGIAEPRSALAGKVGQRYGVDGVFGDAEQMIAATRPDALVVPQQFTRHEQVVAPLYAHGLPILTEKPLAMSTEVGLRLVDALDASPTPFHMVGYHKRSDPAFVRARQLIEELKASGRWGAVRFVRMTISGNDWSANTFDDMLDSGEVPPPGSPDAPEDEAYVDFVNFYVHQVNLVRAALGEPYRVVYADRGGRLLIGESTSGAAVSLELEPWGEPGWDESIVVGFDQGWIRVTFPAPLAPRRPGTLEVHGDLGQGPQTTQVHLPAEHAMLAQARNFVSAIRGDSAPPCEAHDALEDLRLADQYFEAKGH